MRKIKANLVFEILGRPKEHIKEALTTLVMKIGSDKGVKIIEKQIHEPVEVKEAQNLFTTFAEVSFEFDSTAVLLGVAMAYMPAHIEVVEPETLELTNTELNELSNALVQRMHNYDAIVKKALMDRNILESKLKEVAPHLFKKPEEANKPAVVESEVKKEKKGKSAKKKNKK